MTVPQRYSVVIICNNEEATIGQCIQAAKQVSNDIIVVDSGSTDNTPSIVKASGAHFFEYEWKGYSANKNFGNGKAKNDWIISLDADEVMDNELISIIKNLKPSKGTVFQLNSLVNFEGQWIRHSGWFPVWKHRIFNKQEVAWNDSLVHEDLSPLEDKKIVKLNGVLLHYSFKDKEDHLKRIETYAKLRAQEWIQKKKSPSILKRFFGPSFRWFRTYILKLGLLDGKAGWYISANNAKMIRKQIQFFDQLKSNR